jgi:hypothetical protein
MAVAAKVPLCLRGLAAESKDAAANRSSKGINTSVSTLLIALFEPSTASVLCEKGG